MDQICVVGVDAMSEQHIKNLISANKVLVEDVLTNDSFSIEEKEKIKDRLEILTAQLWFWTQEDNKERFCYELKEHINWMLKNYS